MSSGEKSNGELFIRQGNTMLVQMLLSPGLSSGNWRQKVLKEKVAADKHCGSSKDEADGREKIMICTSEITAAKKEKKNACLTQ